MSVCCSRCGSMRAAGAKFCGACGATLASRCAACGSEVAPDASFCMQCGSAVALGQDADRAMSPAAPLPSTPPSATGADGGVERRHMTFVFCDLVGSTQLSREIDLEDLRDIIGDYRETAAAVVRRYEGTIAQYYGDGILIYFGYPIAHEDDARRAVQTALDIVAAVATLNARRSPGRAVALAVRIGVHTGVALVGDASSTSDTGRLAVGDAPNVAARIQGLAAPDSIIISAATHELVTGFFHVESLGLQPLQGVSEPLEAFRVLKASGAHHRVEAVQAAQLTPYIGRQGVVAALVQSWQGASEVSGRVAVLTGEAGVGKSRLVHMIRQTIAADARHQLACFCSPYYQASPLYPMAEMLRSRLGLSDEPEPQRQLESLRLALDGVGRHVEESVGLIAPLVGIPPAVGYQASTLHPVLLRQRTIEILLELILQRAEHEPTLLIIEDVHWIDPSTLDVLGALLPRIGSHRLLVVMTTRPSFRVPWPEGDTLLTVPLTDLSPGETETMIQRISGDTLLPPQVLSLLVRKSEGNPLYVEEMTRMLLESGWAQKLRDSDAPAGPLPDLRVPTRLQDLLMARLDRMEPEAKQLMQLGATVGREFSLELLLEIRPGEQRALSRGLDLLLSAGLVYAGGNGFTIKHALIQDAAYESLSKRLRQKYHEAIARALEGGFAATPTHSEHIALHLTRAGLAVRAVPYWLLAGKHAVANSANTEAASQLRQGLDLIASLPESTERDRLELDLLATLGTALSNLKGYAAPEVAEVYSRAQVLAGRVGPNPNLFWVEWGLWAFNLIKGDQKLSIELAHQLMALARDQRDDVLELEADFALGLSHYVRGELPSARACLERAVSGYMPETHHAGALLTGQDVGVASYAIGSLVLCLLGEVDLALERSRQGIELARRLGHPFSQAYSLGCAAILDSYRRDSSAMAASAKEAVDLSQAQAAGYWLLIGMIIAGRAVADGGDMETGIAQIEGALGPYRAFGSGVLVPNFLAQLAEARAARGDFDRAAQDLADARRMMVPNAEAQAAAEIERIDGDVRLLQARARPEGLQPAEAVAIARLYQGAIDIARGQGARLFELRALAALARLQGDTGEDAAATRQQLEAALERMPPRHGATDRDVAEARQVLEWPAATAG